MLVTPARVQDIHECDLPIRCKVHDTRVKGQYRHGKVAEKNKSL